MEIHFQEVREFHTPWLATFTDLLTQRFIEDLRDMVFGLFGVEKTGMQSLLQSQLRENIHN